MAITASLVKELRERTGSGMMECKKALVETDGDIDAAAELMRKSGAACVLVSGGFSFFTEAIASRCGFSFNHGNTLDIQGDALTGKVVEPILDKLAKVGFLKHYMENLNLDEDDCLTIGDGANDLPMLKMAGLGIGFHPKEAVKSDLVNCILYGDLTTALYAQGLSSTHFERL